MNVRLQTKIETKARRKDKQCRVFELKVVFKKANKKTKDHLNCLFIEDKWLYNHFLNHFNEGNTSVDTKIKEVGVKVGNNLEQRELTSISAQMKQSVKQGIWNSLRALSKLKKNGHKVGRLKFKSFKRSIELVQFGMTYKLDLDNSKLSIQGLKQKLKVRGCDQLRNLNNPEYACARLIKKESGYYLQVTTYTDKELLNQPEHSIGIDFGCEKQLTFSNGVALNFQIEPSKRQKRINRRFNKQIRLKGAKRCIKKHKRSINSFKNQSRLRKEYEKLTNKEKRCKKQNSFHPSQNF
jgi:putative transposase